jgi:hypothetical protein
MDIITVVYQYFCPDMGEEFRVGYLQPNRFFDDIKY